MYPNIRQRKDVLLNAGLQRSRRELVDASNRKKGIERKA